MITVIERTETCERVVRGLLYDNANELTGDKLPTTNCGLVECEYGSWAVNSIFGGGEMEFKHDDAWHAKA